MRKVEEVRDAMMAAFDATPEGEDASISMARAAIEAMREPTQAMIDSCGDGECSKWAPGAWAAYIDAALREEGR